MFDFHCGAGWSRCESGERDEGGGGRGPLLPVHRQGSGAALIATRCDYVLYYNNTNNTLKCKFGSDYSAAARR